MAASQGKGRFGDYTIEKSPDGDGAIISVEAYYDPQSSRELDKCSELVMANQILAPRNAIGSHDGWWGIGNVGVSNGHFSEMPNPINFTITGVLQEIPNDSLTLDYGWLFYDEDQNQLDEHVIWATLTIPKKEIEAVLNSEE